jgi:hypothetical protein
MLACGGPNSPQYPSRIYSSAKSIGSLLIRSAKVAMFGQFQSHNGSAPLLKRG